MAKLPKAIQDEIERAEAIEKALTGQQEAVAEAETSVEAPQADARSPETPQADMVAETPAPSPDDDPNSETWEHRYRVLQGKYDRDVPVLHARVRELEAQMSQMAQRAESQPTEPSPTVADVTPEEVDTYGEDLVNLMRRVAAAEAMRKQAETLNRVDRVESSLQLTEQDRFYAALSARVPQWKDIDNEPGWLSWLGEYDPMAGMTRQDVLTATAQAGDAERVASIFETYLRGRPAAPAGTPASLQSQVVPRGQGSQTQSAPQRRIYTQAEIKTLLDPRHLNRLPADQQEAIERDIDLAYSEGRIAA